MPGDAPKAVQCLNELIVNALGHAMDCLKYLERLKDIPVFRFCAIPQVLPHLLAACHLFASSRMKQYPLGAPPGWVHLPFEGTPKRMQPFCRRVGTDLSPAVLDGVPWGHSWCHAGGSAFQSLAGAVFICAGAALGGFLCR